METTAEEITDKSVSKDERGTIEDLKVGENYSITHITFNKGAIRGNHYHKETIQYDTLLSGMLLCKTAKDTNVVKPGQVVVHEPGNPHAYQALEDSVMASICFGKRIGENYESDTFRLDTPLL